MNTKGFSLTEVLVTISLLAIMSGIAVMGYGTYRESADDRALRTTLNSMASAFMTCMSFNNFDSSKCNDKNKVKKEGGYIESPKHTFRVKKGAERICLDTRKAGSSLIKACVQYNTNGSIVKKCFKKESGKETICDSAGVCCDLCTTGDCEIDTTLSPQS